MNGMTRMTGFTISRENDPLRIEARRRRRLDSLPVFQELFLELQVRSGTFRSIRRGGEEIGYAIISSDGTLLLEFHTESDDLLFNRDVLSAVVEASGVSGAYCQTFDSKPLHALSLLSRRFQADGILFRRLRGAAGISDPGTGGIHGAARSAGDAFAAVTDASISMRFERIAEPDDFDRVTAINDGFFESGEELSGYIENGNVVLFEGSSGELIGCGLRQRIAYDYPFADIGMLVNPSMRRNGYGTAIVTRLASICRERGEIPICGCGIENTGSAKTLSRAGFVPKYELLKFSF